MTSRSLANWLTKRVSRQKKKSFRFHWRIHLVCHFLFLFFLFLDLTRSHGIRTNCSLYLNNAQHSFAVTKAFCPRVTQQMQLICSRKISSTTQSTTPATNTFSVADALMSTNSGTCGVQRVPRASRNTSTRSLRCRNISHRSWKVVKVLSSFPNQNARIFASGTSHRICGICRVTKFSTNNCTKSRQKSKSGWWRKELWWSHINRWMRSRTSSAWCFKTRRLTSKTWCISLWPLRNTVKSFKCNNVRHKNHNLCIFCKKKINEEEIIKIQWQQATKLLSRVV